MEINLKLDKLMSLTSIAKLLRTPEDEVTVRLEEGRLSGTIIATLRTRGVAVTPSMKNTVEGMVNGLPRPVSPADVSVQAASVTSEGTATIMFTDIVRKHTQAHGGVEVKNMGDGFMLSFNSARKSVACAVAVQKELRIYKREHPDVAPLVRMGMSVGEPIREAEDMFGKSVILAARISAKAGGRQILVCNIVHALMSNTGDFTFEEVGEFELKGIADKQRLFEVVWR